MVKFLISRPIAVSMTFIAILVLAGLATRSIPVSLMPDIAIPEITVQISADNMPARELEDAIVKNLRRQLLQTAHLADIKSVTTDENSLIHLTFDYGTDIDYAFIEVNEKIDRAMGRLPRDIERPKVIKASATDLPVFYLNLTLKGGHPKNPVGKMVTNSPLFPVPQKFIELGRFSSQVIRKRLEQLPEVAMVDMSGIVYPEILIMPDMEKLRSFQLSLSDLEAILKNNDVELGNLLIRDGQYQYNVRFTSAIKDIRDIKAVYLKVGERILQLNDIAQVIQHPQKRTGMALSDGKDAISMAIIKQSDAQMMVLKDKLDDLIQVLKKDYPDIEFTITHDQTKLLDYSISNMKQSLVLGACLAFVVMFFFLRDFKSPLLIGITIPTSLLISLLCFYLAGISINIISLSGLVLGVGMMVDNSIIVIDNITQHFERAQGSKLARLSQACIKGTNEVFRPMLSAVLTTCAVFVPLIFISGISGALFYDQAMAVTIGLFVSLAVAVTILPVYYKLIYSRWSGKGGSGRFFQWTDAIDYEGFYERGFRFTLRHQKLVWMAVLLCLASCVGLFYFLEKSRLPDIEKDEVLLMIDWNDKVNIHENNRRVQQIIALVREDISQNTCMIGEQQFLLNNAQDITSSEAIVYLKATSSQAIARAQDKIRDFLKAYPLVDFTFEEAENIFGILFADEQAPLTARLISASDFGGQANEILENELDKLQSQFPDFHITQPVRKEHPVIRVDQVNMMTYDIALNVLYGKLKSAFNERQVMLITENEYFTPIVLGGNHQTVNEVLASSFVPNRQGVLYPISSLVSIEKGWGLEEIVAGQEGEYFPVDFNIDEDRAESVMQKVKASLDKNNFFEATFTGSVFSNKTLMDELIVILGVSLLLLYFILASQFESLSLPLIVLMEIPIGVFGAFLLLLIFGQSINLMAMIGIVVMCGITINDSILKIDTVNQLRQEGYGLLRALAMAGQRRLKAILMTSLTTVLALVPLLFSSGMGADLQMPLALAVIGGMTVGTLVSLFFIPLCYYYLNRKSQMKGNIV